ncbi:hypothetical protein [Azospirillum largimobile]
MERGRSGDACPHLTSPAGRGRDCRHSPAQALTPSPAQRGRVGVGA